MKLQDANLQVNESSFRCILPFFSEYITISSSEEALKVCEHNFFQ